VLERNNGDREALAVVRRQFHTLKGSGRMVGLTQLGDIATRSRRSTIACSRKSGRSRPRSSR
jgi:chemotaxis protein histidine kinase CheA